MNNKAKKVINKISTIILNTLLVIVSILIIIGLYYLVQIKILNNSYANIFGYTFFEVATGSMSNTIEIGDVVIVKITKEVQENETTKSVKDIVIIISLLIFILLIGISVIWYKKKR